MKERFERSTWQRWHRLTNRHMFIIPDAGGEIRFCLRRFPGVGVADGVTYKRPGSSYRSYVSADDVAAIIRCRSAEEVAEVLGF